MQILYCVYPEVQKKVFYGQKRKQIGAILRNLFERKVIHIVEAEICPDHVHMLVEISPRLKCTVLWDT